MPSIAERMMRIFAGLETAHGTYTYTPPIPGQKMEIRGSAKTLRTPVTVEMWQEHIDGKRALGIVPIRLDDTCSWGAIDVDSYDISHAEIALEVMKRGLPLILCRSKSGGAHLFYFVKDPVPAARMIAALRRMASVLGVGTSEVFPKQTRLLHDRGDLGNWIAMPYFGETQEAIKVSGSAMTISEFLTQAEKLAGDGLLENISANGAAVQGMEDGPPCLQHLTGAGFPEGTRNNGLFALGVYCRKKWPGDWETHLEEMNRRHMRPPLEAGEVAEVIRNLKRKPDYNYRCSEVPLVSHCNRSLCQTRRFGVGDSGALPQISSMSVFGDPPIWFIDIDGQRLEMTTEELQSFKAFQRTAMERLRVTYPLISQPVWIRIVREAMESVIEIESPPDIMSRGVAHEIITEFCTNRQQGQRSEDLLSGRVFLDTDNQRYVFRMQDLHKFMTKSGVTMTRTALGSLVRDLGGGRVFFNIKGKGINAWQVSSAKIDPMPFLSTPPLQDTPI